MSRRKENSDLARAFGTVVRRLRKKRGFSQEGFAYACGLDRAYYGLIERGAHTPTIATLWTIAKGFDGHPADLVKAVYKQLEFESGKPARKLFKSLSYNPAAEEIELPKGRRRGERSGIIA